MVLKDTAFEQCPIGDQFRAPFSMNWIVRILRLGSKLEDQSLDISCFQCEKLIRSRQRLPFSTFVGHTAKTRCSVTEKYM